MHRSGSSLAAQLVNNSGVFMGEALAKGNHYNPDGYFEYTPLVRFHEKMLEHLSITWYLPYKELPLQSLLENFGDEARNLIEEMDRSLMPWCWKDPRMAIFLPFWEILFEGRSVYSIVTSRNPAAIAASLQQRSQLPEFHSLALWEHTFLRILTFLYDKQRSFLLLPYESFIENAESACRELIDFLSLTLNLNNRPDDVQKLAELVNSSLNRQKKAEFLPLSISQQKILQWTETKAPAFTKEQMTVQLAWLHEYFALFQNNPSEIKKDLVLRLYWKVDEAVKFSPEQCVTSQIQQSSIEFKFEHIISIKQLRFLPGNVPCSIKINEIFVFQERYEILPFQVSGSNAAYQEHGNFYFTEHYNWLDLDLEKSYDGVTMIKISFTNFSTGVDFAKILVEKNQKALNKLEFKYDQLICRSGEIHWLLRQLIKRIKKKFLKF
jgi:hypothetical protein